ncbi:DHH family phosphoesterase [Virgibacillus byunsanensis]|uniref:DHH family phosphoesterase n=1 Tax=Virgibacillus byunsanensis TaxID=570945 RepID=A0ABW3LSJ6_9BACI
MYKLLSHNDLDGVGCGILAKLAFGKQVKVRYNSIGSLDREVKWFLENDNKDTFLLITDLSVNEESEQKLDRFHREGGNVQLLDHHKTGLHFNEYEWGSVIVEDEEGRLTAATSLLYDYLLEHNLIEPSKAIAEFVELVRQYDTWEWERNDNQEAHRLNALFFLVTIEEFEEKMMDRLLSSDHFYFDDFEKKILDMEDNKIERYIRRKRRQLVQTKMDGKFSGIVYAEMYHSELGNELNKEYPHLDYIVILDIGAKRVGFRTIHDHTDVSEVAGKFGGGGHAKASGCSLTEDAYKQFVAETFNLEPLREDAKRNRYNLKETSFGSLYKNQMEDLFFLYPTNDSEWVIERNNIKLSQKFPTFVEGENFLKRNYTTWLARDETFVNYLKEKVKKG